jgi:hypothetical protein
MHGDWYLLVVKITEARQLAAESYMRAVHLLELGAKQQVEQRRFACAAKKIKCRVPST